MPLAQLVLVSNFKADGTTVGGFKLDPLTNRVDAASAALTSGETITLSGVTTNGLVKTIKLVVK